MSASDHIPSVLCAGRVYCDLVFSGVEQPPSMGKEVFAEGLALHAGGGAAITAATFSALGHSATLCATLPAAPFDEIVRDQLNAAGIDLSPCDTPTDHAAPQITVAMANTRDRAFLSHKSGAAIPDRPLPEGQWQHLHIGELRSLVEHPDLVAQARARGMSVSLDCGWDEALMADGAGVADLIGEVDVFLPNATEHEHLMMSGLSRNTNMLTVVKSGSEGAGVMDRCGWVTRPARPVQMLDATGAGDAFNGGFLSAWLSGAPLVACLDAGNKCGAIAVQNVGGNGGFDQIRRLELRHVQDVAE